MIVEHNIKVDMHAGTTKETCTKLFAKYVKAENQCVGYEVAWIDILSANHSDMEIKMEDIVHGKESMRHRQRNKYGAQRNARSLVQAR